MLELSCLHAQFCAPACAAADLPSMRKPYNMKLHLRALSTCPMLPSCLHLPAGLQL